MEEKKEKRLIKNKSTPESRAFWENVERAAKEVGRWPAWKQRAARWGLEHLEEEMDLD